MYVFSFELQTLAERLFCDLSYELWSLPCKLLWWPLPWLCEWRVWLPPELVVLLSLLQLLLLICDFSLRSNSSTGLSYFVMSDAMTSPFCNDLSRCSICRENSENTKLTFSSTFSVTIIMMYKAETALISRQIRHILLHTIVTNYSSTHYTCTSTHVSTKCTIQQSLYHLDK